MEEAEEEAQERQWDGRERIAQRAIQRVDGRRPAEGGIDQAMGWRARKYMAGECRALKEWGRERERERKRRGEKETFGLWECVIEHRLSSSCIIPL